MPFTLAHPAAVLPLRGRGLPMPALVAGAMVPDTPQLAGVLSLRDASHSLAGVVTVDLAMGMVALVLWYAVFRRPLADLAPDPWRDRLPEQAPMTLVGWLLSVPGVIVGALTHVVWDAFTHEDGWVVERWSPLAASVGGAGVYAALQIVSSIVGLAIVVWYAWRVLRRLPRGPRRPAPVVGRWALISVLAAAALSGMVISALVAPYGAEAAAYYLAVTPILTLGFGLTCLCVWWQLIRLTRGSDPASRSRTVPRAPAPPR